MNILLTGGTGYIASHTAVVLAQAGHELTLFDNLSNSSQSVIENIETIIGKSLLFVKGDIRDTKLLIRIMSENQIDVVIHFAGLKSVADSISRPLSYYANNVQGSISLLEAMQTCGLKKLIFSSSATVYGMPKYLPYDELHPLEPINPYGKTKLQIEDLMHDLSKSDEEWTIICLRYFNPVGAHKSALIGECPNGVPNNLMPYVSRVASGELQELSIFGDDYDTLDGTGERDFIHVMDLAEGHMAAVDFLRKEIGWHAINLGTGKAHSVMEVVKALEKIIGKKISAKIVKRRLGDMPVYYAKIEKSKSLLGWQAKRTLDEMCESAWNYQIESKR
ncbi:UDP-glucose 4-epimerase GalE [Polynucleobacter sp. AP-Feld-500C-C5]|uniref:UDP-glucose 4-epimerase GalE n=1 Tax=Polynucleobacter sp. AP-Feld-500C-C5 TaxID=2576924 RepID=UPI001C0D22CB|nr:UDP-glucose 4-epimerase GalE [Polynucleobacter sp. AP-Feld-500C-C5]MBU3632854.1 UDP-glucose 4-epimerase GalE [Polynucleobacter sp. AP-Feld-500C-C5]